MRLELVKISKFYELRKHFYLKKEKNFLFEELSLSLNLGENLLIKGESGSGKSTLAKIIAMLEKPSSGKLFLNRQNLLNLSFEEQRLLRKKIQYVFQEQKLALNPHKRVKNLLFEVYENFNLKKDPKDLVRLLELFELDKGLLELRSANLSTGEAMRLGLLRALILKPNFLILDELSASLDRLASKKILSYLKKRQENEAISYIFITHQEGLFEKFKPKKLNLSFDIEKLK
ncbi:peptide ABC transporter ATP-binding protein [Campylobacter sp. MIT 99-7217]|uniref:ATP-binding cassette domain-containing protein n=1 Tax=Campylobacter sp. MIT 99-7217 TaxID=535091 RepID=UPI00115BF053|nr:ATP-binding cassette domain-containing protein [Campylobacter sp. MIT 99-7217]TQR32415.1 peptide ABC transporter ATP-binding protein [Campylobacter sp. MIT 99-7217]